MFSKAFFSGMFFLGILINAAGQNDCDFKLEKEGIKVYTCERKDSKFKAIRATFEVETTPAKYAAVTLNVEDYKYWNYAAANAYVVEKINEKELFYYAEAEAPWPVTDRFVVLHLKVEENPLTHALKITLENVPDRIPKKEGFVRVVEYYSLLEVTPISKTRVKVEYYLEINPAGSIPAWAVNMVSTKFPITTFSNFKKRLKTLNNKEVKGIR
jgi:hypothetical protein